MLKDPRSAFDLNCVIEHSMEIGIECDSIKCVGQNAHGANLAHESLALNLSPVVFPNSRWCTSRIDQYN